MSKVAVVYWSQTGNTQEMAEAVCQGIVAAGKEAELLDVSSANIEDLKAATAFALGCPAMGDEVLEESEMEPFVEALESFVDGKNIGLFGSYGWGSGQWMQDWEERMTSKGAKIVGGQGLICQDSPDEDAVNACKALGEQLASF